MPRYFCSLTNERKAGRIPQLVTDDPKAIAAFVKRWDVAGRGTFYCVSTLKPGAGRRSRETFDAIEGLHVDLDPKDIVEGMDIVDNKLGRLSLPPSEVRSSGRGRHAIWLLKEPLTDIDEADRLLKRLTNYLCGDPNPAHPIALLRVPGSFNTKDGGRLPCRTLVETGHRYDPSDIADWLDDVAHTPVFTRRPAPKSNGHDKHEPFTAGGSAAAPVDVAQRLAAMRFKGPGDTSIHVTQLSCTASLLRAGCTLDHVVEEVLEATRKAVAGNPRAARWDWTQEAHDIRRMCADFISTKHPELYILLPDKLRARWEEAQAQGRRPMVVFAKHIGWHVRSLNGAAGEKADTADEKQESKAEGAGDSPRKFRFKLVSFGELRPGLEPLYLVDELIPIAGLVDVWGKAKCYKSFWTLDLMLHVAMGWEYRDRYVRQGAVVYCAFEGAHGYKKRVEALRRHYNIANDIAVPLYVMPGQANLIAEHKLLISDITAQLGDIKPVAVVLDTLNKSLFGSENKDVDMGAYVRAAEAIRDTFGCVVIIVHHCGYDDTRPRGHSSLPGAVDAQLAVTRTEEIITVTVEMMRDGPEDTQVVSAAEVVEVGQDQNGKTLTSLVIVPSEASPAGQHHGWPRSLAVFHTALKIALASHGQAFQPEAGVLPVRAVDQWMVRERFYATYAEAEEDEKKRQAKIQKAFVRAVGEAQSRGVAKMRRTDSGQTMIWLPERGEGL